MRQRQGDLQYHVRRTPHILAHDRFASLDDKRDVWLKDDALAPIQDHIDPGPHAAEVARPNVGVERRVNAANERFMGNREGPRRLSKGALYQVLRRQWFGHLDDVNALPAR